MVEEGKTRDDKGLEIGQLFEHISEPFWMRAVVDLNRCKVELFEF